MNEHNDVTLQALARAEPGVPATVEGCRMIWQQLVSREIEVAACFAAEKRCYLALRPASAKREPLTGRNLEMLERALLGAARKSIAYDFGVSPSTLAQILKQGLAGMNLVCPPASVPPLLVILAHASRGISSPDGTLLHELSYEGRVHMVLSSGLDATVMRALPPAEREVLHMRLNGRSYADIASQRRTSYRTVANQIAAACHRLGVSGRLDLLHLIATSLASATSVSVQGDGAVLSPQL